MSVQEIRTAGTICLLLLALLTGCATSPTASVDDPTLARISDPEARRLLLDDRPLEAADRYSAIASRAESIDAREDALLLAAEILYDRGLAVPGAAKRDALPPVMSSRPLEHRRRIVEAKARLFDDDAEGALAVLPNAAELVSSLHRARLQETRAMAFGALDDPRGELAARIALERELEREPRIDRNQAAIWQLLTTLPLDTLREMTTNVESDTYQGWVELALAHETSSGDRGGRATAIERWEVRFPNHPARARLVRDLAVPTRFGGFGTRDATIERIGVLLPLSDPATAAAAAAIRDGLIAARTAAATERNVPSLRFHDIGENPAYARTAYREALDAGANAVIGPLRKSAVAAIASQQDIRVPTVLLNTVDTDIVATTAPNLVQFGLDPEDEAAAAAGRAAALSLRNAIVLQSDDERGSREALAFQDALYRRGGDVVHVAVLPNDQYDYSDQIRQALQITEGDERFRVLSGTIGERLFFEPAIRNDVDMVFLAISSEQARSVGPQLDFFRAGELPRFGTSRIASVTDDVRANADLDGIEYPDVPWILSTSLADDPLRESIVANFPGADGVFARLYALGADAWTIVTSLGSLADGESLPGFTGELRLDEGGRVIRTLDWAVYENGSVIAAEPVEIEPVPTIRSGDRASP